MTSVRIGRDDFKEMRHDGDYEEHHHFEHIDFHRERRAALPPVPDLRFEYTYLKNIRQHVHIERKWSRSELEDNTELPESSSVIEIVHVDWGSVFWITIKEQFMSPLLQGTIWCVHSCISFFYTSWTEYSQI